MATDEWKQVYTGYQKWLSTQPIYSPNQIKKINDKLDAQIRNMPTSELQGFLNDWQAKLKILNGKNFQEAQNWLGAYLTNMADGYKRNYLHSMGLIDIPSLSAKQLESAITEIRANQSSIAHDQAVFDQAANKPCKPSNKTWRPRSKPTKMRPCRMVAASMADSKARIAP